MALLESCCAFVIQRAAASFYSLSNFASSYSPKNSFMTMFRMRILWSIIIIEGAISQEALVPFPLFWFMWRTIIQLILCQTHSQLHTQKLDWFLNHDSFLPIFENVFGQRVCNSCCNLEGIMQSKSPCFFLFHTHNSKYSICCPSK